MPLYMDDLFSVFIINAQLQLVISYQVSGDKFLNAEKGLIGDASN